MITTELDPKNISAAAGKDSSKHTVPHAQPAALSRACSVQRLHRIQVQHRSRGIPSRISASVRRSRLEIRSYEKHQANPHRQTIVGPADEQWDDMALVQYPNIEAFQSVAQSDEYQRDAEPHRLAALENVRLIGIIQRDRP